MIRRYVVGVISFWDTQKIRLSTYQFWSKYMKLEQIWPKSWRVGRLMQFGMVWLRITMCVLADVDSVLIYWLADMPKEGWNSTTYQRVGLIKAVEALNTLKWYTKGQWTWVQDDNCESLVVNEQETELWILMKYSNWPAWLQYVSLLGHLFDSSLAHGILIESQPADVDIQQWQQCQNSMTILTI